MSSHGINLLPGLTASDLFYPVEWLLDLEHFETVVILILVVEHVYTFLVKQLVVIVLARNENKLPMDRAILWNQQVLAIRMLVLAALIGIPWFIDNHPAHSLSAVLISSALVAWSATWLLREFWRERLAKDWLARKSDKDQVDREHEDRSRQSDATERLADATERIADQGDVTYEEGVAGRSAEATERIATSGERWSKPREE